MLPRFVRSSALGAALLAVGLFLPAPAAGDAPKQPAAVPTRPEVEELLRREPITPANWPAWRGRLLAWIGDRTPATDPAYRAARAFAREQATAQGELPPELSRDALAWYFLGSGWMEEAGEDSGRRWLLPRAEQALRRSLQLDANFAPAHSRLALALLYQEEPAGPSRPPTPRPLAGGRWNEIRQELARARQLDPSLPTKWVDAQAAVWQGRFGDAEMLFREAMKELPQQVGLARGAAQVIVLNDSATTPRGPRVQALLDAFPDDGVLVCLHAAALYQDGDPHAAVREFARARALGTDPAGVLAPEVVRRIEEEGAPSLLAQFGFVMLSFAGFYALVMALMAGGGVLLAGRTRGDRALDLLGTGPDRLVAAGQVARTRHESALARAYALALFAGLILFYAAIPFVVAGLLAGTALLLYLIFLMPRIPVKLIVIIVVVGLGGAWAVLKSLFTRPGRGSFGLARTATDCPRVYQVLAEVAGRVDTDPVDEVYLAPGSSIGVHQEGRGPFGIFGVKRRVLTLGLSTMHFLTVDELKSILAHEYAHFSHADTFYSRFIYQVTLSIEGALNGMAATGGWVHYVNPFYWFLFLYYKTYRLLAAGYSRSREFLADRMASGLYGSNVFASALTKVRTDGTLFEMTMYDNIARLLGEDKAFVNMYASFRSFRDEQLSAQEREELYQKLLGEEGHLFASHPTFKERMAAVAGLPRADQPDATPALNLFDNVEQTEQELTEYLTAYVHHLRSLQARAAAAAR
jgi:Zn-dependent protease with chaperone function